MNSAAPSPTDELPRIPGYEIKELIGEGGMGVVYRACQLSLQRTVAIKCLRELPSNSSLSETWRTESRLMASLAHPNIVGIFDCGDADGRRYLVMEHVGGPSLRERIVPDQPWPLNEAVAAVGAIAEALSYIHEKGILHLDLKPENVLCDELGRLRITDFGLALHQLEASVQLEMGLSRGSVDYCSPEHRYGLPVDARSDLFSLAAMTYELLTGRQPGRVYVSCRESNAELPAALDDVLEGALARNPEIRPATVAEFRRKLLSASARPRRTRRALTAAVACGIIAGLAWGLTSGLFANKQHSSPTTHESSVDSSKRSPGSSKSLASKESEIYTLELVNPIETRVSMTGDRLNSLEGKLPTGWTTSSWQNDAAMETLVCRHEGRWAMGLRNRSVGRGAMLKSPEFDAQAHHCYEISFDYWLSLDGGSQVFALNDCLEPQSFAHLSKTPSSWATVRQTFTPLRSGKALIEFHSFGIGENSTIYISHFQVHSMDHPHSAPEPLYRIDFSATKSMQSIKGVKSTFDLESDGNLPEKWGQGSWKPGNSMETRIETLGGERGLAIRNIVGATGEIYSAVPFAEMKQGQSYLIKLNYRGEVDFRGEVHLRSDSALSYMRGLVLKSTESKWREVTLFVTPEEDARLRIHVQNQSEGPNSAMYLRDLEVIPLTDLKSTRKAFLSAQRESLFAYKFNGRADPEKVGDGSWPQGWGGNAWDPEGVGTIALEHRGKDRVIKLKNEGGTPSMQIWTDGPICHVAKGRRYLIRVRYQAGLTTNGRMIARAADSGMDVVSLPLPSTFSDWRDYGIVFVPTEDMNLHLLVENNGMGDDATLWIQSLDVSELSED